MWFDEKKTNKHRVQYACQVRTLILHMQTIVIPIEKSLCSMVHETMASFQREQYAGIQSEKLRSGARHANLFEHSANSMIDKWYILRFKIIARILYLAVAGALMGAYILPGTRCCTLEDAYHIWKLPISIAWYECKVYEHVVAIKVWICNHRRQDIRNTCGCYIDLLSLWYGNI